MHTRRRELFWMLGVVASLVLLACTSLIGYMLLPVPWFRQLFRIPGESVFLPFFIAVLSVIPVTIAIPLVSLVVATRPQTQTTIIGVIGSHAC